MGTELPNSERCQLIQIDNKLSELAYVEFGVPQGSILGPVLFNLYVADLQKELDCPCYQYADDTTFFLHTKVADLGTCVNDMKKAISRLGKYSSDSNLALNEHKQSGCCCPQSKWHTCIVCRQRQLIFHVTERAWNV